MSRNGTRHEYIGTYPYHEETVMRKLRSLTVLLAAFVFGLPTTATAQTTYDLPTGKTLTIINQLPESIRPYFDESDLATRFGRYQPAANYRIAANIEGGQFHLIFMIPDFSPEDFSRIFYPRDQFPHMLTLRLPHLYLSQLRSWYNSSFEKLPHELKEVLSGIPVSYHAIFQKGEHWIMFTGIPNHRGLVEVTQPITSNDPRYGSVSIPSATHSGPFRQLVDQGFYPLDPPINRATGEKNASWLLYDFFNMAPTE